MNISQNDATEIENAVTALNKFLDSDAYMEMVNGLDTPPEVRKRLNQLWDERSKLVSALLRLYASQIAANEPKYQALLQQLRGVNQSVSAAADGLRKISERIQEAVEVAKGIDKVLQTLSALGVMA